MPQKPLQEFSLSELNKQRATLRGIILSFAIMSTILLGLNIYLLLTRGNGTLLAVNLALIPVIIPVWISLQKVNEERKLRTTSI